MEIPWLTLIDSGTLMLNTGIRSAQLKVAEGSYCLKGIDDYLQISRLFVSSTKISSTLTNEKSSR